MPDIIIVGAGGHARVVADVVRLHGGMQLYGFIDQSNPDRYGSEYEGARILGGDDLLTQLRQRGVKHAVVAIGENRTRQRIGERLLGLGFELPPLVHPRATVASSVRLGAGTVVFAGAIINPATRVGEHVIINTGASVDHDCVIGAAAHIAPGVHIAGGVTVGERTLIGVGASIKPNTHIGSDVTVGVGAAVVGDVANNTTVVGVPARPRR